MNEVKEEIKKRRGTVGAANYLFVNEFMIRREGSRRERSRGGKGQQKGYVSWEPPECCRFRHRIHDTSNLNFHNV